MTADQLQFRHVSFVHDTAREPLLRDLDVVFPAGWSGVIGPNGCGKTTLLRLVSGDLEPTSGEVRGRARTVLCPQRPEELPPDLADLVAATDGASRRLAGTLGLEADWPWRWETLSDGERKRAQIAVALRQEPRVLGLDEPTNHIDAAARRQVIAALRRFLTGSPCRRDFLLRHSPTTLALGDDRTLAVPALEVAPQDRIAVTGPNGAGKSTLVRHVLASLDLPAGRVVSLAQEIGRAEARRIVQDVRALDRKRLGKVMTVVGSLGSDPERLLDTTDPSPGELRKLLLALGLANDPWLIVMDEPTNHLDLPSIECLEDALAEVPCALILVSHDERFLETLTTRAWRVGDGRVVV